MKSSSSKLSDSQNSLGLRCSKFTLPDDAATYRLGQRFARALSALYTAPHSHRLHGPSFPGLTIHLLGDIGAGKTTFVRAVLRALGYLGHVRSPTYTLVEPYSLIIQHQSVAIYHFDLYRFSDPSEWIDAGFRDYFNAPALCFVEWPQQAGELIGIPDLALTFEILRQGRLLITQAFSPTGEICVESIQG